METYDITGLSVQDALLYIKDITVHLKTLELHRNQKQADVELWEGRIQLAQNSQRADLAQGALDQKTLILKDLESLNEEIRGGNLGLEIMKQQLNSPGFTAGPLRDQAEALLRDMEDLIGKPDTLGPQVDGLEVDAAFEELKKNLGN